MPFPIHSLTRRRPSAPIRLWAVGLAIALALALVPPSAHALQDDPRLDSLFETLHEAEPGSLDSVMAQQRIWEIWVQAETASGRILMSDGLVHMRTANLEAALETFTALIDLEPDLAEAWNKRATVHYMMGNYDASIADIEKVLELEPRHFGAQSGLGMIHDARGDLRLAVQALEAALEMNPHMHGTRARVEELKRQIRGQEL